MQYTKADYQAEQLEGTLQRRLFSIVGSDQLAKSPIDMTNIIVVPDREETYEERKARNDQMLKEIGE